MMEDKMVSTLLPPAARQRLIDALCQVLSRKGGSDLYSKADADAAFAVVE